MWILDTNALIECHKRKDESLFKRDQSGTTIFSMIEFPIANKHEGLTILYPALEVYADSFELAVKLRDAGTPIPTIDILIGAMIARLGMPIVTGDSHFETLRQLDPRINIVTVDEYIKSILELGQESRNE